jgi:PPK2 family polyphosphate:nucleotide phosphotransferase
MEESMSFAEKLMVNPGHRFALDRIDPSRTPGVQNKEKAGPLIEKNLRRLAELQYLLYAESRRAVLIVIQAMDAGGKDGTIRHVMSGLNPQGCKVTSFKVPTAEELHHDFLWRIHKAAPSAGEFGIFNRSHYEDVLVVRVHKIVPKDVWSERYQQINAFEEMLCLNQVTVIKFFLHISREEQEKRFAERVADTTKQWKISEADFSERRYWDKYMSAYEDALVKCSTPWAPWFVIPADHKWYRNLAVSNILVEKLEELRMEFPKPIADIHTLKRELAKA